MRKGELKQARSVHRALDILEHLADKGASNLHAIHLGTGLSKATLRRLLATLSDRGYVRRGLTDRIYRSNVATPLALEREDAPKIGRLFETARPHMIALTREISWPVGLHYYVAGRMRVIETTHGLSPFGHTRGVPIDYELNIFAAASGLAWLSANNEPAVLDVIKRLADDEKWSLSRFGIAPDDLLNELTMIRQHGWARRRTTQGKLDDRIGAAVAIYENSNPIAALNITWHRDAMSYEEFSSRHLGALKKSERNQ